MPEMVMRRSRRPAHAQRDPSAEQIVEVTVRDGYHPRTIAARAGVPLRIIFHRQENDACTQRVVFSEPRLERHLAAFRSTTVDLPARPAGLVRFTCGMGRYRGQIQLVDEAGATPAARLRERLGRLETPLGTALVLWICSLPLIALLGVLVLDTGTVLAAAAASLIAWVAGCLLAFRAGPASQRVSHAHRQGGR